MCSSNNQRSLCVSKRQHVSWGAADSRDYAVKLRLEGQGKHISFSFSEGPEPRYKSSSAAALEITCPSTTVPLVPSDRIRHLNLKNHFKPSRCRRHLSSWSSAAPFHSEGVSRRQSPHSIGRTRYEFAGLSVLNFPSFDLRKMKSLNGARFSRLKD